MRTETLWLDPSLVPLALERGGVERFGTAGGVPVTATIAEWCAIADELAARVEAASRAPRLGVGGLLSHVECRAAAQAVTRIRLLVGDDELVARAAMQKLAHWVSSHHRSPWPISSLQGAEVAAAHAIIGREHVFGPFASKKRYFTIRFTPDESAIYRLAVSP